MKTRRQTIKLKEGDVRMLRICRGKHAFRLAIYDDSSTVPLIQAKLSAAERHAIRTALGRRNEIRSHRGQELFRVPARFLSSWQKDHAVWQLSGGKETITKGASQRDAREQRRDKLDWANVRGSETLAPARVAFFSTSSPPISATLGNETGALRFHDRTR